ncbi:restriction endonuclease subunit S [Gilliamella apicola]|uniref:restriction endonuclease subunit S n=1 Tax=Gilliamella apicola TaxID=1196095 RepID=UPI002FEDFD97
MSQNKKLVPKRRFKNSLRENEWQLIRLGDQAVIKGRLGWKSLKQEEYVDNGPSMIAGKHITNGVINWYNVDHIPQWRYDESPEIMLRNGDIIFSKDGSLGNPALIEKLNCLATINSTMMLVRLKKSITPRFFYQIMLSNQFENLIRLKVSGSSIPHLFQADMTNFKFCAPKLTEQTQIGEFFKKLDTLIQTQQKKLEKTKTLKSAYLAEMFPCDGELKPKLRFDEFSSDWQLKKIDNITNRHDNQRIPITASNRIPGSTPYYGANGIQDYVKGFTHNGEYILVAEDGANDLLNYPVQYVKGKIWVNNHAHVLQGKNNVCDNKFLMYAFKCINMEPYLVGGGRAKLNSDIMMNIIISAPDIKEQTKIGNFFKLLDKKIALEQRKLEKLNNIKQAYLNEMFV